MRSRFEWFGTCICALTFFACANLQDARAGSPCNNDDTCNVGEDSCGCPNDCPDDPNSCSDCECGISFPAGNNCACDTDCFDFGDCCGNACDECSACGGNCGNGTCGPTEDCGSCPEDCVTCGDGCCNHGIVDENSCSCPEDCSPLCGDGCCDLLGGEDACSCSVDCFDQSNCGDGCCDFNAGENPCNCLPDCLAQSFCGDGCCDTSGGENSCNCLTDCVPSCGDGCCDLNAGENPCNCFPDCFAHSDCGDGCCDPTEDCESCEIECGACPLANDLCEDAISIGIPSTTLGSTGSATVDSDFPTCPGSGTPSSAGVWYSVTGNGNTLTASLCNPGTTYDTKLTVYCDNCTAPACVAGNDDACGFPPGHSQVSWCSASGATYLILVHGFGDSSGDFVLQIAAGAPCSGAVSCDVEPTGACCDSDIDFQVAGGSQDCFITSQSDCQANGGDYQGDGTVCEPGICDPRGACCNSSGGECREISASDCQNDGGTFLGAGTTCTPGICTLAPRDQRLSTVKKGSLLYFSKVELRWDAAGNLTQDTILTLVNDFTRKVRVKLYLVNGDAPTDAIYADPLNTILVERAHKGWNQVDCVINLTENESTYLVMSNGVGGCQRFTILDTGTPPGRPNLEPDGGRVLRGFVVAFAVDENQEEISYNHLSGHADLIQYGIRSAWEYQAYAFQAINPSVGTPTDGTPGELSLDGLEYDYAFNTLLFDFFAVGSTALSNGGITVMLDTDLTLHPVTVDLRQDSCGPITTKAHFDIWNANEDFRSGTTRCITCWDQTLLSAYSVGNGDDNNFILADLGTDKGKARIDGMASTECDNLFNDFDFGPNVVAGGGGCAAGKGGCNYCRYNLNRSENAALLGVAAKVLTFSGGATGTTWAGMNLVGAGQESAQILFDVPTPPESSTSGGRPGTANYQRSKLGQTKGK